MSISLIQEPGTFNLAKNQIPYIAQSDNYITVSGQAFVATLGVTSVLEGETLVLTIKGVDFTYRFTESPTECTDVDTSTGVAATIKANLWARLAENYYLSRYFTLSPGTNTITANELGTAYAVTQSGTGAFSFTVVNPGVNQVTRESLRIYWDLYVSPDQTTPNWAFVAGQDLAPDQVARINPDMADLLRSRLSPDIPVYGTAAIAYNVNSLKKFQCRTCEYFDSLPRCYVATSTRKVMLAGIALDDWPFINFDAVYGAGVDGQLVLTNQPRLQVVDAFSKTFLSILVEAAFTVKAEILWTDGTTSTHTLFTVAANTKSMAIIPTGYDALDIGQYHPVGVDKALEYAVYIDQSGDETERYRYVVDWKNKLNPRYFLFHNSLNGWDTIFCTGDQARKLDNKGKDYDAPVSRTFKAISSENNRVDASTKSDYPLQQRVFAQNTGYKPKTYVQNLARELALTGLVYLDYGDRFVEVKIDKSSIQEVDNDSDDLWSLNFSFSLGFMDIAI